MKWTDIRILERLAQRSAAHNGGPVPLDGDFFQPDIIPVKEQGAILNRLFYFKERGIIKYDTGSKGTTVEFSGKIDGMPPEIIAIINNRFIP